MSDDVNNSLFKQEQKKKYNNTSGRNLLIIAFVFAAICVFCVYWFTRNQSNPDKKTAVQTGYGWYADPIIGPCITSDGKCGDDGQLTVTKTCIPHPVTLKGCKSSDGTMTYNTLIEHRHCNLQCIGSNFNVQNAVEIYKGVSINGVNEVPIHIGGHYLIDKNSGIEYTKEFIGSYNHEKQEYDIKNCIKDTDNYVSYSVTTHECNEYDKRGPNNCFYNCNEYSDVLRQSITYDKSNPASVFFNYPKDTNSDGSYTYRCYDIFGNNQVDILNNSTKTIPQDFFYPNICYRHFNYDQELNNVNYFPYGTSNVFSQTYKYSSNQDWFMVNGLCTFSQTNPNFIDYDYDIKSDYHNYILADINNERTIVSKVRNVYKLTLPKLPLYIYLKMNTGLTSSNGIEITTPLKMINFNQYQDTTLTLQNSGNAVIYENVKIGNNYYFRSGTENLLDVPNSYTATPKKYSLSNNVLTIYVSDSSQLTAFDNLNNQSSGNQIVLINIGTNNTSNYQLATLSTVNTVTKIITVTIDLKNFNIIEASKFGFTVTPFMVKNNTSGILSVSDLSQQNSYNLGYFDGDVFLSHLALAPEINSGTSNPYNIINNYSYRVYANFSKTNNLYRNIFTDKTYYIYGTDLATNITGYYYPLVTESTMNVYDSNKGTSIQFQEYNDFIFYFPSGGLSVNASLIPPNPNSSLIDFAIYNNPVRSLVFNLPIYFNSTDVPSFYVPQIPIITFAGWTNNNPNTYQDNVYYLIDPKGRLIGFFELTPDTDTEYAIQVIRNEQNDGLLIQIDNNQAPVNVFTEKMRIYSNFLKNVTKNYNQSEKNFDIVIGAQKGIIVEADYTVFRSPFLIDQGSVKSVCFDEYNRPLPPETVIQIKPNSGQKIVTYRQTPINASNTNCGTYTTSDGLEISEYRESNSLVIEDGACISNFENYFQTEGYYGMDGVCLLPAICTGSLNITSGGVSCREPYYTRELETNKDYYKRQQFFELKSNNHFYISKLNDNAQNNINNSKYWNEVKGLIRNEIVYNDEKFYVVDDRTNQIYFYNVNLPGIVGEFPIYYANNYMYDKQFSFYSYYNNAISDQYLSNNNIIAEDFFSSKNLTTDYLNPGNILSTSYNITYSSYTTNNNNNFKIKLNISLDTNQLFKLTVGDYIIVDEKFLNIFTFLSNFINNPQSTNWSQSSNYVQDSSNFFTMSLPTAVTIYKGITGNTSSWYLFDPFNVIEINTRYLVPIGSVTILFNNVTFTIINLTSKTKVSNTSNLQNFYEGFNNRGTNPENFYIITFDQINNKTEPLSANVQYNLKPYITNATQLKIEEIEEDNIVVSIPYDINTNFLSMGVCTSEFGTSYGINQYGIANNTFAYTAPSYFSIVKSQNITTPQAVLGENTLFLSSAQKDKCMFIVETYLVNSSNSVFIREYAKDRYKTINYRPKFNINDKLNFFSNDGLIYEATVVDINVRQSGIAKLNVFGVNNTNINTVYSVEQFYQKANFNLLFDYQLSFTKQNPFPYTWIDDLFFFKTYFYNGYACNVLDDTSLIISSPLINIAIFNNSETLLENSSSKDTYSLTYSQSNISPDSVSEGYDAINIGTNNNIFIENFFMIENYKTQNLMICTLSGTRLYNNNFPDNYIEINNIDINAKPYGPAYVKNSKVSTTFTVNKTNEGYGSILSFEINTSNTQTQNIIATVYPGLVFKTANEGYHVFNITDQEIATFDFISCQEINTDIRYKYNFNYQLNDIVEYKKPLFKVYYQNEVSVPITYQNNFISDEKLYYKGTRTGVNGIYGIYYPIYITNPNSDRTTIEFNQNPSVKLYTDSTLQILSSIPKNTRAFDFYYMNNVGQWNDGVKSFFNEQNFGELSYNRTYLKGEQVEYNDLLYQADSDFYISDVITPGLSISLVSTFKNKLTSSNNHFYSFTTDGLSTLSTTTAKEIYNSLYYNTQNLPYTVFDPITNKMKYLSVNNRGLCTGVATYNSVFNQFPNFEEYKPFMNKVILIEQGVCGVISMPSLFYSENNIDQQGFMKENYSISIPPYLTSYLYSMPFGNDGENVGKPFCSGTLPYGNKNASNLRFANSVLFYPLPLSPDSQDWYKLTFNTGTGVSYLNYTSNMKYNYSISSGTCTLINSDTDNTQIFGNITLKRNKININISTVPGNTSTINAQTQIGDGSYVDIILTNAEYKYLPFLSGGIEAILDDDFSPNLNDLWYVKDIDGNILSHGIVDENTGLMQSTFAIYKYPDYPVPEGSKLFIKTTDTDYNTKYSNGICIKQRNPDIGNNYLNKKQLTNFDINLVTVNPFIDGETYLIFIDKKEILDITFNNFRSMNSFAIYSGGTSITFDSTKFTSYDYFYLLDSTEHLKIKMYGFFYNEELASITYQNTQNVYSNDGSSIPVMSFTPYKSQILVPEEERSITWGINQETVEVSYPNYFDVFNLIYKGTSNFGLCAIAYNKPLSSDNKTLNLNNFIDKQSSTTSKIGVINTNSVTKLIADEINLNDTMKILGTVDDIIPLDNPYSPKAEYFNSLRRNLYPNRIDDQLAHNCFAYENTSKNQDFPYSPNIQLVIKTNGDLGVSSVNGVSSVFPTLYNLNTVFDQSSDTLNDKPMVISIGSEAVPTNSKYSVTNSDNIIKTDIGLSPGICVSIKYYIDGFNMSYDKYHDLDIYNAYQNSREVVFQAVTTYGTSPEPLAFGLAYTDNDGKPVGFQGLRYVAPFNYTVRDTLNLS